MTVLYGYKAKRELDDNYPFWQTIDTDEQTKVNHTTCEMGEDKRERMNITNKGGAFLWHCYNCSNSGYYREREYFSKIAPPFIGTSRTLFSSEVDPEDTLSKCIFNVEMFSTEAKLWLAQYEMLDQTIVSAFRIGFNPRTGGVVLPVWQDTEIVGWQERRFDSMYKHKYHTESKSSSAFITNSPSTITGRLLPTFIVEDLLSAYKLHWAGASVWCLMGTSIKHTLIPAAGKVVLWLDSDLAGEAAAVKLYKELTPVYPTIETMYMDQPKEVPFTELFKLVSSFTTHEL